MCIVAVLGLVLNVRNIDRDTTRLLFGGVVDLIVRLEVAFPKKPQYLVIAAVRVVLPWSICPIVPTLR
jgi:hypothetical protein